MECQSTPSSRPESRQSDTSATATMNPLNPLNPMSAATIDEWIKDSVESLNDQQWKEAVGVSDRLALTLEEIVHIRSVMTKAELEGLPVGIRVKEDVERRKVCFLCLRTRFTIFGQWGVKCKLCQRTVCSKCYSKVRGKSKSTKVHVVMGANVTILFPFLSDANTNRTFQKCTSGFTITVTYDNTRHVDSSLTQSSRSSST